MEFRNTLRNIFSYCFGVEVSRVLPNGTQVRAWRGDIKDMDGNRYFSVHRIFPNGAEETRQDGRLQSINDRPAIIRADGTQEWYKYGCLHRERGPAIIHPDGTQEWFRKGSRVPAPKEVPSEPVMVLGEDDRERPLSPSRAPSFIR